MNLMAAGHVDRLARDEASGHAGQEANHRGNLIGHASSAHGNLVYEPGTPVISVAAFTQVDEGSCQVVHHVGLADDGQTALTVTVSRANSKASDWMNPMMPDFDAE